MYARAVQFNVVKVEPVRVVQQAELLQAVTEGKLHEGDELLWRPRGIVREGVLDNSWVVGSDGIVLAGEYEHLLAGPQHQVPRLVLQLGGDLQVSGEVLLDDGQREHVGHISVESCRVGFVVRILDNVLQGEVQGRLGGPQEPVLHLVGGSAD